MTIPDRSAARLPEGGRAALVIGHPGHELRVHGWLEAARPVVFVLTDGSGHTGRSRLASTMAVLERTGATPGSLFGRLSDRDLYDALLAGNAALFTALADELALALDAAGVDLVAGDAVEGFNPGHDVCRLLINAALQRLARQGRRIASFELPLDGPPHECPPEDRDAAIFLELDEESMQRKLAAAHAYPELAGEVERAFANFGWEPFRIECLRPVRYGLEIGHLFDHPPYYETYGERQVAAGIYQDVIRFHTHLAPLARKLGAEHGGPAPCASC